MYILSPYLYLSFTVFFFLLTGWIYSETDSYRRTIRYIAKLCRCRTIPKVNIRDNVRDML